MEIIIFKKNEITPDLFTNQRVFITSECVKESCYGNFDTTAYHTWRTAFRETSKLAYFDSLQSGVENQHRLEIWTSRAQGLFGKWCLQGAKDGLEFFQESQGDLSILKNSFRWQWLRDRFVKIYGEMD